MAQSSFQADRRPLTTPIQPTNRAYDPKLVHMDERFPDVQLLIDPSLTVMETESQEHMNWHGSHTSLKQYLRDPSQAFYTMGHAPYFPDHYGQGRLDIDQIALASHFRQESPFSQQPSFSSGESLGPPTESDASPSTPPDTSFAPQYHQPYQSSSDAWRIHQSQMVAHMGGLHVQESPSVNPVDINPSQTFPEGVFALSRSSSFGPEAQIELHSQQTYDSSEADSSLETPAKDTIHIHTPLAESLYPDPDTDNFDASETEQDPPRLKHEDDDGEWTPKPLSRKRGHSGEKSTAPTRNNARSPRKRAKVSAEDAPVTISSKSSPKHTPTGTLLCSVCDSSFTDEATLQKHTKSKHLRPFTCVFHFAGCPSSFPSKNEWKRHVMTQHLALHYWLCTQGTCAQCANPSPQPRHMSLKSSKISGKSASALPNGAIFNRKDLFTQHVRRMHPPSPGGKSGRNQKSTADADGKMRQLQVEAERKRCQLPAYMTCPAASCNEKFTGSTAWDDRMEHVAKHLEKACEGLEPKVRFGGEHDTTLTKWAESPEVGVVRRTGNGQWELVNTLRGCIGPSNGNGKGGRGSAAAPVAAPSQGIQEADNDEEVDADGDDD